MVEYVGRNYCSLPNTGGGGGGGGEDQKLAIKVISNRVYLKAAADD